MALDFTLLSEEKIWGDDALDVIKMYGTKVAPTDLAIILGTDMPYNADRTSENDLACWSWSSTGNMGVYCIDPWGNKIRMGLPPRRYVAVRPALSPSEAHKLQPTNRKKGINGVEIVEYGEYPQTVADERRSKALEYLYHRRSLRSTGKKYTFDSAEEKGLSEIDTPFKPKSYREYQLDGKKYVRVPGYGPKGSIFTETGIKLSDGKSLESGKPYWVEVQPIEWLTNITDWMVAKKCLFAGIQFNTEVCYYGDFSKTFMKHYLDTYFAKEMMPIERVAKHSKTKIGKIALKKRQVTR